MWKIIFYIIGVIYTAYIAIMHEEAMVVTLLIFELIFPLFLLLFNVLHTLGTTVSLSLPISVAEKGQSAFLYVTISNSTPLPIHFFQITLKMQSTLTHKKITQRIKGSVDAKSTFEYPISLEGSVCDDFLISVKQIRIYDYLHLFFFLKQIRSIEKKEFTILPFLLETQVKISEYTRDFPLDSTVYDPYKSGDDPSEIFQLREYREGDRMQTVHWKKSIKDDTLMIKEYSRPIGCAVLFLLNLPNSYKHSPYEAFFELFYSLSFALLQAECKHYVAWFDSYTQDITRIEMGSLEDLHDFLSLLLKMTSSENKDSLFLLYQEKYRGETFSGAFELNENLTLKKNDEEVFTFHANHLEEELATCTLTI